jgi:hypothetical protein
VKGSVAALADLVFLIFEWEGGWSPGAFYCALAEFHHLLGEILEEVVDVEGSLGTGLHEGHLVSVRCVHPHLPS